MNDDAAHLSQDLIERHGRHTVSPAELLRIDQHIAFCEECRGKLVAMASLMETYQALVTSLRTDEAYEQDHPGEEQWSAYLDGILDEVDRETVEGHLEFCPRCATEATQRRAAQARVMTCGH
jgi:anti-sigma factor RsiW